MGSFVMSWVTEGHEIESETGVCIDVESFVMRVARLKVRVGKMLVSFENDKERASNGDCQ